MLASPAKPRSAGILDDRAVSVAVFALFSAWLLTVSFEGRILYALADKYGAEPHDLVFGAMAACFGGLATSGFFIRSLQAARNIILGTVSFCALGSSVFLTPPSLAWSAFLWAGSFLMGLSIASWGHYVKYCAKPGERTTTVAEGLIYSNILMIAINVVTANVSPYLGLALAVLFLGGAFALGARLVCGTPGPIPFAPLAEEGPGVPSLLKPLLFLFLFVGVITVDSGLMYQVISPAYTHHATLSSWYWAIPYIAALYVMKRSLGRSSDKSNVLYVALAMMGLAFLAFMTLDRSVGSYLLVDTLMLGAFGVYDLFWWSVLADLLEFAPNPGLILGVGLSSNVLGVLVGGLIGRRAFQGLELQQGSSVLALAVLFVIAAMLPRLQRELSLVLKDHAFLTAFREALPEASREEKKEAMDKLALVRRLTDREREVADLLLQGRTYKDIAHRLFVSENTVKYHVKNIYAKVNVQNKVELVNLLTERVS